MFSRLSRFFLPFGLIAALSLSACNYQSASLTLSNPKGSAQAYVDSYSDMVLEILDIWGNPMTPEQLHAWIAMATKLSEAGKPIPESLYPKLSLKEVFFTEYVHITYYDKDGHYIESKSYNPPHVDVNSKEFHDWLQGVVDDYFAHYNPDSETNIPDDRTSVTDTVIQQGAQTVLDGMHVPGGGGGCSGYCY